MASYKIKVPVTTYHEVSITVDNIISILEQEQKNICGGWDTIKELRDGRYVYYDRGYGSHDIGEEEGDEVSEVTKDAYLSIEKVMNYFQTKKQ